MMSPNQPIQVENSEVYQREIRNTLEGTKVYPLIGTNQEPFSPEIIAQFPSNFTSRSKVSSYAD